MNASAFFGAPPQQPPPPGGPLGGSGVPPRHQQQQGQPPQQQQQQQQMGGGYGYQQQQQQQQYQIQRSYSRESSNDELFETLDLDAANTPTNITTNNNTTILRRDSSISDNAGYTHLNATNTNNNNGGTSTPMTAVSSGNSFFGMPSVHHAVPGNIQTTTSGGGRMNNYSAASRGPENFSLAAASSGPEIFSMPQQKQKQQSQQQQGGQQTFTTASSGPENFSMPQHQGQQQQQQQGQHSYGEGEETFEYEGVALQTALNAFGNVASFTGGLARGAAGNVSSTVGGVARNVGGVTNVANVGRSVMSSMVTPSKLAGGMASWRGRIADVVAPVDTTQQAGPPGQQQEVGNAPAPAVNAVPQQPPLPPTSMIQQPPTPNNAAQIMYMRGHSAGSSTSNASAAEIFAAPSPKASPMLTSAATVTAGAVVPPPMHLQQQTTATTLQQPVTNIGTTPTASAMGATTGGGAGDFFNAPSPANNPQAQQSNVAISGGATAASTTSGAGDFFNAPSPANNNPQKGHLSSVSGDGGANNFFNAPSPANQQQQPQQQPSPTSLQLNITMANNSGVNGSGVTPTAAHGANDFFTAPSPANNSQQQQDSADDFFNTTTNASIPPAQPKRQMSRTLSALEKATHDPNVFQYADPLEGRATIVPGRGDGATAAVGGDSAGTGDGIGGGMNVGKDAASTGNSGNVSIAAGASSTGLNNQIPAAPATGGLRAMEFGKYTAPTAAVLAAEMDVASEPVVLPTAKVQPDEVPAEPLAAQPAEEPAAKPAEEPSTQTSSTPMTAMEMFQGAQQSAGEAQLPPEAKPAAPVAEPTASPGASPWLPASQPTAASTPKPTVSTANAPASAAPKTTLATPSKTTAMPTPPPPASTSKLPTTRTRLHLPIPKKPNLPLPPPLPTSRIKKPPTSGNSAGLSLGSKSGKSGLHGTSHFRKPPPMEIGGAGGGKGGMSPRFHVPGPKMVHSPRISPRSTGQQKATGESSPKVEASSPVATATLEASSPKVEPISSTMEATSPLASPRVEPETIAERLPTVPSSEVLEAPIADMATAVEAGGSNEVAAPSPLASPRMTAEPNAAPVPAVPSPGVGGGTMEPPASVPPLPLSEVAPVEADEVMPVAKPPLSSPRVATETTVPPPAVVEPPVPSPRLAPETVVTPMAEQAETAPVITEMKTEKVPTMTPVLESPLRFPAPATITHVSVPAPPFEVATPPVEQSSEPPAMAKASEEGQQQSPAPTAREDEWNVVTATSIVRDAVEDAMSHVVASGITDSAAPPPLPPPVASPSLSPVAAAAVMMASSVPPTAPPAEVTPAAAEPTPVSPPVFPMAPPVAPPVVAVPPPPAASPVASPPLVAMPPPGASPPPGAAVMNMALPTPTSIANAMQSNPLHPSNLLPDTLPQTPSSRVTECDAMSDYQSQVREEDFIIQPPTQPEPVPVHPPAEDVPLAVGPPPVGPPFVDNVPPPVAPIPVGNVLLPVAEDDVTLMREQDRGMMARRNTPVPYAPPAYENDLATELAPELAPELMMVPPAPPVGSPPLAGMTTSPVVPSTALLDIATGPPTETPAVSSVDIAISESMVESSMIVEADACSDYQAQLTEEDFPETVAEELYGSDEREDELSMPEEAAPENVLLPGLPEGWIQATDNSSGNVYYYNEITGESSWDKPVVAGEEEAAVESPSETDVPMSKEIQDEVPFVKQDDEGIVPEMEEELAVDGASAVGLVAAEGEDASPEQEEEEKEAPGAVDEDAAKDEDGSALPEGWEEAFDPGSNRIYYYNPVTGASSWDRPTVAKAPDDSNKFVDDGVVGDSKEDKLLAEDGPPGEETPPEPAVTEELQDGDGKGDHPSDEEHDQDEHAEPELAEEVTPDKAVEGEEVSSKHVADATDEQAKESGQEEPAPSASGTSKSSLPEGWIEASDPNGNVYYYNQITGSCQWERPPIDSAKDDSISQKEDGDAADESIPKEEPKKEVEPLAKQEAAAETFTAAAEEDDEGIQKKELFPDEQVEDKKEAGAKENGEEVTDALPEGWIEATDPTSGKVYYYNADTGASSWDRPRLEKVEADETAGQADVDAHEAEVDTVKAEENAEVKEHESDIMDATGSSVVDDVQECTQEPDEGEADEGSIPEARKETLSEMSAEVAIAVEEEHGNDATADEADDISNGWPEEEEEEENKDDWIETTDPGTGNIYYYNPSTGETSWTKSSKPQKKSDDIGSKGEIQASEEAGGEASAFTEEGVDGIANGEEPALGDDLNMEPPREAESSSDDSWTRVDVDEGMPPEHAGKTFVKEGATEPINEPLEEEEEEEELNEDDLPKGWSEAKDPSSGNVYYYNKETGAVSWERPVQQETEKSEDGSQDEIVENSPSVSSEPSAEQKQGEENSVSITEKEPKKECESDTKQSDLPEGWMEATDAEGRVYYYNEDTGVTSWERPVVTDDTEQKQDNAGSIAAEAADSNDSVSSATAVDHGKGSSSKEAEDEDELLPEGWVEVEDPSSGRSYYYHETLGDTTWVRPTRKESVDTSSPTVIMQPAVMPAKSETVGSATVGTHSRGTAGPRPAHAIATFGFGGRLCVMIPQVAKSLSGSVPKDDEKKTMRRGPVVIHRLNGLIPRSHEYSIIPQPASRPLKPLIKMNKDEVLTYLENKSDSETSPKTACDDNLLWNVVNIAAHNHGQLRNSTKAKNAIVDMLLAASKLQEEKSLTPPSESSAPSVNLNEVQNLLLRGERESAVSEALDQKNYALALIIASMCSRTTYQIATQRFADEALPLGSPLHTAALLFSNNLVVTNTEDPYDEGNGEGFWYEEGVYQNLEVTWRKQLTSILSNQTPGWEKIVLALGDRLLQLNQIHAAHVCYLVSISPFGPPSANSTRLVLLGCDHRLWKNRMLMTPESIVGFERTEAFEWARRRGNRKTIIPSLQPFKLRYAELLADFGYEELAREYLLNVRSCIGLGEGSQGKGNKSAPVSGGVSTASGNFPGGSLLHDPQFIDSLKLLDDRICMSIKAEPASWDTDGSDDLKGGGGLGNIVKGVKGLWGGGKKVSKKSEDSPQTNVDGENADQADVSSPLHVGMTPKLALDDDKEKSQATTNADLIADSSSATGVDETFITAAPSFEQPTSVGNDDMPGKSPQLLSNPFSHNFDPSATGVGRVEDNGEDRVDKRKQVDLHPPSSAPPIFGDATADKEFEPPDYAQKANEEHENKQQGAIPSTPIQKAIKEEEPKKKAPSSEPAKAPRSGGWFSKFLGRDTESKAKVADVGEEMQAYYDEKLKRWIFPGDDLAEVAKPLAPPPIIPKKSAEDAAPATPAPAAASNDPLAMLMAPPPSRGMSSHKKKGTPPIASRYADPLASMGNVMPPSGAKIPPASPMMSAGAPPVVPTFTTFQPKPAAQPKANSDHSSKDDKK